MLKKLTENLFQELAADFVLKLGAKSKVETLQNMDTFSFPLSQNLWYHFSREEQ
jgi:hypothetical protein